MPNSRLPDTASDTMDILSRLVLSPLASLSSLIPRLQMSTAQLDELVSLAHANHVVVRGMETYRSLMLQANDLEQVQRADGVIAAERARIAHAMAYLQAICAAFCEAGLDVTVIKTLDHWPDFGSDMDLYTNAVPDVVLALMQRQFEATIASRSWGDRLAGKWNLEIPGLPEAVEIHMCRLGQTGEHLTLAENIPARSRAVDFDGKRFRVPSPSDRIMISTLQRMYRHFYFRLCDIVDSAGLVASGVLDYEDLRRSAQQSGIWEGVATYLVLVSDYVWKYTGSHLVLPKFVRDAARFDGKVMYCGKSFLRVPIVPQSAELYRLQLLDTFRKGEISSGARLGLLPWLATAAAIGHKITGSDKGIW
ncbi:MAG: hypothetical protein HOQ35_15190 [Acidobacteriaceae bacterium]|nr:hypothetical protein [Acidobacteriaceae bacterium]